MDILVPRVQTACGCSPISVCVINVDARSRRQTKKTEQFRGSKQLAVCVAAVTGAGLAARRRCDRRLLASRWKMRLRAGGEEGFEGLASDKGVRLWLGEGLGPYVSRNYNDRRQVEAKVRTCMLELLRQAEAEDAAKMEYALAAERMQLERQMVFLRCLDKLEESPFLTRATAADAQETEGPFQSKRSLVQVALKDSDEEKVSVSLLRGRVACLEPARWNELLAPDDSAFLDHSFLSGLEESGCVSLANGWQPRFLFAWRNSCSGAQLVGAVPLYIKMHIDGEFCAEADWIEAEARNGIYPCPRLFVGVPFTPHRGRRLLTAAWLTPSEHREVQQCLMMGLKHIAESTNISVNVAFSTEAEHELFSAAGFITRVARQAWWCNRSPEPYSCFPDFLRTLRVKRARDIEKERSASKKIEGVSIEVLDGSRDPSSVTPEIMVDMFWKCYAPTQLRHGNVTYSGPTSAELRLDLNEELFKMLGERLPHRLLLVLARHETSGSLMGGSLCFVKDGRISGRYWGPPGAPAFLHFECCYNAVMEHAIKCGYSCVEPGNGGGDIYKVQRRHGFEPVLTPSYHFVPNLRLREEVEHIAEEAAKTKPSWTAKRNSAYAPVPRDL
eukprot:TRINITY_DN91973_c0_g1_i1.p1 TRINITY_DN91973_c0_g1~~TRINITY_DN91973_c0_g1_i1.p1  ORF type:complete len:626 (-),score=120.37 TRINITY_DN91973_c0_g1_i1:87-1928(-)